MSLTAEYAGWCLECEEAIEPGEQIRTDDGEWVHVKCPPAPSKKPTKFQGTSLEAMGF
jgi:hypothetical protein